MNILTDIYQQIYCNRLETFVLWVPYKSKLEHSEYSLEQDVGASADKGI